MRCPASLRACEPARSWLVLLSNIVLAVALVGCAHRGPVAAPLVDTCTRVELEPSPLWTASASWDAAEERLVIYDPGSRSLSVYDAIGGALEHRVENEDIAALNEAVPIRIHTRDDGGYLLGDKERLLWLDASFTPERFEQPFRLLESSGLHDGGWSDFAPAGENAVVLYGDYIQGESEWHAGFYRVDLATPSITPLRELEIEAQDLKAYYNYDRRPYIAQLGGPDGPTFVLRFTDPVRVERVGRRGLEPLPIQPRLRAGELATALHAWQGRLFLLAHREPESEDTREAQRITEAAVIDAKERAHIQGMHRHRVRELIWTLIEIDARRGNELARHVLPTRAGRLQVVTGDRHWAFVEEAETPNVSGDKRSRLMVLPATWLAGAHRQELSCGP